jgi:DNA invertase Pin-like site-specific DNA recombinase
VNESIPAAQYVRSSTKSQKYSIENQVASIQTYAQAHGFRIVKSFEDAHRSGLTLKDRPALKSLIREVLEGEAPFSAILVYDVSRWGRFQDCDESAHYEFLCSRSGVKIHYCEEPFTCETDLVSFTVKALKRAMAAEASRDSGDRIRRAVRRAAQQGFKVAGTVRFGYRRVVVTEARTPIRILSEGERKGTPAQRILYALGPEEEISCIRDMFKWAACGMRPTEIAAKLNDQGRCWHHELSWNADRVRSTLRNPIYTGVVIYGRTSARFRTPKIQNPSETWVVNDRVAPAIISKELFAEVQTRLRVYLGNILSDEEVSARLKLLLKRRGRLSELIINRSAIVPSVSYLKKRFGTMQKIYDLAGFSEDSKRYRIAKKTQRTMQLHRSIVQEIANLSPEHVAIFSQPRINSRPLLDIDGHTKLSLRVAVRIPCERGRTVWRLASARAERHLPALLCLLDARNRVVDHYFFMPPGVTAFHTTIEDGGRVLSLCHPLKKLNLFYREFLNWFSSVSINDGAHHP